MSNTEASRAWEYLRRNPAYIEAWRTAQPAAEEPAPFPLRAQRAADREAAAWGLLAWEDPDDGPASPFWADAPMLEAVPSASAPALVELLTEPEVRLSALRLAGGAAIVKVEHGEGSVQIRIADGAGFDPAGGIALRLPLALDLQMRLRRTAELWPIAGAGTKKRRRGPRIPDAELLMVLDARLAGRSLHRIAMELYGEARVVEDWHSDGSMRARVRWRVKQALRLMNGGYRELVSGGS